MTAKLKLALSPGYHALTPGSALDYIAGVDALASRLGGRAAEWKSREVGDGNLNLVFILEGPKGAFVMKQALPYVRLVGESWPLPLSRAHFEHMALAEEYKWASNYVPTIYHHDPEMALTVMEYLSPHIILRKGLIKGLKYPHMARHLGEFLARTLFHTSDLYLGAAQKKEKIAAFLPNTAMCKISEDLIFDEPYFDAPMNRHTKGLEDIAKTFRKDVALKKAVQAMKWRFMNAPEALIHGDLHTGSVMVTETDTRVIDPEFAFYGPMGFDVGAILANLFMACFAKEGEAEYRKWMLAQTEILWDTFAEEFSNLWRENHNGDVYNERLNKDAPDLQDEAIAARLERIWADTLGFAACKIIRRILGLAHVEDFESITDETVRAAHERKALVFARELLIAPSRFKDIFSVNTLAQ